MAKVRKAKYLYQDGVYYEIGGNDSDAVDQVARDAAAAAQTTADAKPDIDDATPSSGSVYSSEKIESIVGGALYFQNVAVAARTGDIVSINNAEITDSHVVAECVFANPSAITTDVTWTTAAGSLVLNGTCSTATTVNLVLVKTN